METAQEYVLEENPEHLPELCHLQTGDITLPKNLQRSRKNVAVRSFVISSSTSYCGECMPLWFSHQYTTTSDLFVFTVFFWYAGKYGVGHNNQEHVTSCFL